jgi:predicted Zn-dependent protease
MQLDPSPAGLAQAEQQAERALALNPTPHSHQVLGRIALSRKEYVHAASELNASLAVKSNDFSSYGYLSQAYAGMGRTDLARKASADYQRADARARAKPRRGGGLEAGE